MTNVPPLAASAAPIRSGTDDGVRAGRSVRASSKRGAVAGGPVVEVVVGGRVVVAVDAVVVVGDRVVVVLSGSVSVVVGRVTLVVVRGSVRVVTGRVTLVVVRGSLRVVPRVIVVVGMTTVVVLSEGTVEVVGMGSASEAPGRIASMSATRTTRPRGPPGPFIGTRSRGLRLNPRGAIQDAPEGHRTAAPEGRQSHRADAASRARQREVVAFDREVALALTLRSLLRHPRAGPTCWTGGQKRSSRSCAPRGPRRQIRCSARCSRRSAGSGSPSPASAIPTCATTSR